MEKKKKKEEEGSARKIVLVLICGKVLMGRVCVRIKHERNSCSKCDAHLTPQRTQMWAQVGKHRKKEELRHAP